MRLLRGGLVIAATYVAFLLFAQFGFLAQARADLTSVDAVRGVMALMGAAGLVASLLADRVLRRVPAVRLARGGLLACAGVALGSLLAHDAASLALAGAAIGASIGITTVAVAAGLRDLVPGGRPGLVAGAATGAAYFACNVPWLFAGSPSVRAVVPAALCIVAAAAAPRAPEARAAERAEPAGRPAFALVLLTFLVLVGLDAAAFATIQATPALQQATWGSGARTLVQGAVHLVAAVATGALLDAGALGAPLVGTWILFAAAFPAIVRGGAAAALGGAVYAAGISIYSVALVVYPSSGSSPRLPARRRAALVYGIAGWLGSALGVGAGQDLGTIPPALVAGSGIVLAATWLLPGPRTWAAAARLLGGALAGGALLCAPVWIAHGIATPPAAARAGAGGSAARGRAVFVAEGCVHCHSSYVRPGTRDEELWGPARPVDRSARPVLVGNRRQGPDLLEVGNRRSPEWNEAHLRDPRALSPGSRMPSYAFLFEDGRGRDLVAYLASLGADTGVERAALSARVRPAASPEPASAPRGRALFAQYCAACHGVEGRGDGPLAARVALPAMNLRKGPLVLVPAGPDGTPDEAALERLIRHGVPPTAMPGHETLPERDVADLAAFVRALPADPDGEEGR